MAKGKLMRIDEELAEIVRNFAKKNRMSMMQASREIAKLNKVKFSNKKILREIKF